MSLYCTELVNKTFYQGEHFDINSWENKLPGLLSPGPLFSRQIGNSKP